MKNIKIFDTTLRDGTQGRKINFSAREKIEIAKKLDEMNIDYIEGGFPISNESEIDFFRKMKHEVLYHAQLVSFGSTCHPDNTVENDPNLKALLSSGTDIVVIVGKASIQHVTKVLKVEPEKNLDLIYKSIKYLKSMGKEIFFDLEHFFDGYIDNPEYSYKVLETATHAGADILILCDTNGGMLPSNISNIMSALPIHNLASLGIHCHDDTGCAVANTLVSLNHGVRHIQGTINGWGERCGNANLCTIIPNIVLKTDFDCEASKKLYKMTELSQFVAKKANIQPNERQPYVGMAAFSHKAGLHADVIEKDPTLIEHLDSSVVGNCRHILLSELSGKATIVEKLKPFGDFGKNSTVVSNLIKELKEKEYYGIHYELAEASFDLLMRKQLGNYLSIDQLKQYKFCFENIDILNGFNISIKIDSEDDLIRSLYDNIKESLIDTYPIFSRIDLSEYRIRNIIIDQDPKCLYEVIMTCGDDNLYINWTTIGVAYNIIDASWIALKDAFEYYLNNLKQFSVS